MKNLRPKPLLFATGLRCIALGQCRSQGQAVMNGNDGQRDQTGGYDRMHDEYEPMPRRCIRAFDCALDENAILVTLADNSGHGASLLRQALRPTPCAVSGRARP